MEMNGTARACRALIGYVHSIMAFLFAYYNIEVPLWRVMLTSAVRFAKPTPEAITVLQFCELK